MQRTSEFLQCFCVRKVCHFADNIHIVFLRFLLADTYPAMPGFRWDLKQDIALATVVVSKRPHKPVGWSDVAEDLNASFSTEDKPVQLKGGVQWAYLHVAICCDYTIMATLCTCTCTFDLVVPTIWPFIRDQLTDLHGCIHPFLPVPCLLLPPESGRSRNAGNCWQELPRPTLQ